MPLWRLQQIYRDDSASLEVVVGSGSMRGLCCQQSLRNHRAAHWLPAEGWFHLSRHCFAYVPIFTQMVVTACRVSDQHWSSQRTRDGEFCGSHCRTSVLVTDSTWIQTLLLLQHPDFCHSRFLINTWKFAPTATGLETSTQPFKTDTYTWHQKAERQWFCCGIFYGTILGASMSTLPIWIWGLMWIWVEWTEWHQKRGRQSINECKKYIKECRRMGTTHTEPK